MSDEPLRPAPERSAAWTGLDGEARRDAYDSRWEAMAARGESIHGEADLVHHLLGGQPGRVVDGGCGTGRVAIELARRGHRTIGVDLDPSLLDGARAKASELDWHRADLVDLAAVVDPGSADLVVLAGNVLLFTTPGTEAAVVAACAAVLRPGGLLVAGFSLRPGGYGTEALDLAADAAGLDITHRWATWQGADWPGPPPLSDYQVSVHTRR